MPTEQISASQSPFVSWKPGLTLGELGIGADQATFLAGSSSRLVGSTCVGSSHASSHGLHQVALESLPKPWVRFETHGPKGLVCMMVYKSIYGLLVFVANRRYKVIRR